MFPVRFSSNATGEAGHWSAGVVLDKSEEESLAFLMRSLRGCADATGRNVIRLNAVGFAVRPSSKGERPSSRPLSISTRPTVGLARLLQFCKDYGTRRA
jgi:hypothetical protein